MNCSHYSGPNSLLIYSWYGKWWNNDFVYCQNAFESIGPVAPFLPPASRTPHHNSFHQYLIFNKTEICLQLEAGRVYKTLHSTYWFDVVCLNGLFTHRLVNNNHVLDLQDAKQTSIINNSQWVATVCWCVCECSLFVQWKRWKLTFFLENDEMKPTVCYAVCIPM